MSDPKRISFEDLARHNAKVARCYRAELAALKAAAAMNASGATLVAKYALDDADSWNDETGDIRTGKPA